MKDLGKLKNYLLVYKSKEEIVDIVIKIVKHIDEVIDYPCIFKEEIDKILEGKDIDDNKM